MTPDERKAVAQSTAKAISDLWGDSPVQRQAEEAHWLNVLEMVAKEKADKQASEAAKQ